MSSDLVPRIRAFVSGNSNPGSSVTSPSLDTPIVYGIHGSGHELVVYEYRDKDYN
ncbi:hypothetical protein F2Q69_00023143 [Brassica cretica]|uniref:Uncharacterized protein n=1 Tax=Brassica cretica TaxID=69181 RepID=A0A8S9PZS4_BRACR|nr:hypothetical protein F2Q69_00023143 [Brassica cretica]